jgi:prephenate dehydrogenase
MKNVCIVGVGLIGGSLGMALRRVRRVGQRVYAVSGVGRSLPSLKKAKRVGALDRFSTRVSDAVAGADIVVLAVPVEKMSPIAKKIRPFMKRGAILTDVGSVKKGIVSKLGGAHFVGGHPIAGSEKAGVENARAKLFHGATTVLTHDLSSKASLIAVSRLWRDAGSNVVVTSAAEHDKVLALTSHLPHMIAFSLFALVRDFSLKNPLAKRLAGPSFNDMTRIAASHPDVWTGIVNMNRRELAAGVRNFSRVFGSLCRLSPSRLHKTLAVLSRAKQAW